MNRHDYLELLILLSGELTWQIQERQIVQQQDELIVIGSMLYHRPSGSRGLLENAVVLYFLPQLIQGGDVPGETHEYLMPFCIQDAPFLHVIRARTGLPSGTLNLLKEIHSELPAVTKLSRLSVRTRLRMILMLLVNYYSEYQATREGLAHRQGSIRRLQPFFQLLEKHYQEFISIQVAAGTVGMSTSHFRRFFKRVAGQSVVNYVNHFRIAKAQQLLVSTSKSIAEIGQETGFCDQSYFGLVFRQLVGMTPLQYRKNTHDSPDPRTFSSDNPPALLAQQEPLQSRQEDTA